ENDRRAAKTGKHGKLALAGDPAEPLEQHQGREDPEPLIPLPAQQEEIRTRFEDFAVGLSYGRKHAQGEEERSHSSELGAVAGGGSSIKPEQQGDVRRAKHDQGGWGGA